MPFVLDASVALGWYFEDEVSEHADRVLDRVGEEAVLVPSVWALEIANALAVAERRGRLSAASLAHGVELFLELPVFVHHVATPIALGSVLDLARAHGMSVYDATYLELAMREGLPLATEDETLRAAARQVGVPLVE